ncbi:hypothetical protein LCGC14_0826220 [marine sediment metagenome]|uniref:Uncharacterized protein n=1 Tax=marine sediment metagenome TaxID=412755 RepID=A0A0F9PLY8_9ZZZZ
MMPDDRDDVPGEGEGEVPVITGEMSEEAITAAALINDSSFMDRLAPCTSTSWGSGPRPCPPLRTATP